MIGKNLLMYDLFKDDFLDSLIFHIPHASTYIPADLGKSLNKKLLQHEINLLTDWATDLIFEVPNTTQVLAEFSRIFCDVERLPDAEEPMYASGRGFFYTKTDVGQELRQEDDTIKDIVFREFYQKHHIRLTDCVQQKLNKHNFAIIIDCHSFANTPFETDLDKSPNRPDICLGVDNFHTPKWLVEQIKHQFEQHGLSVSINSPYSGTIVPTQFFQKDSRVGSIMIEINRKLYMKENRVLAKEVSKLNQIIQKLFINN